MDFHQTLMGLSILAVVVGLIVLGILGIHCWEGRQEKGNPHISRGEE